MWKKKISIVMAAAMVLTAQPVSLSASASQVGSQAGNRQTCSEKDLAGTISSRKAEEAEEEEPQIQDIKGTLKNGTEGSFDWQFTAEDGVLTITGKKTISNKSIMPNYDASSYESAPWYCKETGKGTGIKKIVLKGTIQSVGNYTFYQYSQVQEVDFSQAADLVTLGNSTFRSCGAEGSLNIIGADAITTLGTDCFASSTVREIALPQVSVVPARCFQFCSKLTSFTSSKLSSIGENSFDGCSSMEKTPDLSGYGSATLSAGAFQGTTSLKEVVGLDKNTKITTIGNNCFSNSGLEQVTLPVNTRTLGDSAFSRSQLTQLPAGIEKVVSLGRSCFYGNNNLTEITIPASVSTMGTSTWGNIFGVCTSLRRVEFAAGTGVTALPPETFKGCTALEEVVFPAGCGITSIGADVFNGCTVLDQITFPADCKITSIGQGAFSGCAFTSMVLPSSVVTIDSAAFSSCKKLESIFLTASSLTSLKWDFIRDCTALQQVVVYGSSVPMAADNLPPSGITPDIYVANARLQTEVRGLLANAKGYVKDGERPELAQKIKILTQEDKNRKAASLSIQLEENALSLDEIKGGKAFQPQVVANTSDQSEVTYYYYTDSTCDTLFDAGEPTKIPEQVGIYYIKGYLAPTAQYFSASSNTVQCRVEGVLTQDEYDYDTHSKTLTIKKTSQEMGTVTGEDSEEKNFAREGEQPWSIWNEEIQTVVWAEGVQETRLGDYMFAGMKSLKTITIPAAVTKIGKQAFKGCIGLDSLDLPAGLIELGEASLPEKSMEQLILPESLQIIGKGAFSNMVLQTPLTIPDSVTTIGEGAFSRFTAPDLILPETPQFTVIPAECFKKLDLRSLGDKPFILPEGIQTVGANAFEEAALKRILVPKSVTLIGKFAFYNCKNLKQVALLNEDYTEMNVQRADVLYNYAQVDSVFAATPDDLMILCEGATYTLLSDITSYNYGNKLYSFQTIKDRFEQTRQACEGMAREDYPEEAYDVFAGVLDAAIAQVEQEGGNIFDQVNAILAVEDDVVAAAGTLFLASAEEAGKLAEEDYTTSSWIDFFYPYDDLRNYLDTYGSAISRDDIEYLAGLNAEMAEGRRNLVAVSGNTTPAPGTSSQPGTSNEPGTSSQPGTSGQPGTSDQPGTSEAPGASGTPAPTPGQQVTPTVSPEPIPTLQPATELKKPALKKVASPKKKKVTVQWKKVAGAAGYQVAYSYKKNMKKAKKVTVKKGAVTKKTIGGLKRKKTCYVRIRAWAKAGGRKVYSSWSNIKKVKVK